MFTRDRQSAELIDLDSKPNMLFNSDFSVWQRGYPMRVDEGYTCDRWFISVKDDTNRFVQLPIGSSSTLSSLIGLNMTKYATPTNVTFCQRIPVNGAMAECIQNKFITLAFRCKSEGGTATGKMAINWCKQTSKVLLGQQDISVPDDGLWHTLVLSFPVATLLETIRGASYMEVGFFGLNIANIKFLIKYAKLELGSYHTPHIPLPYDENFFQCCLFYFQTSKYSATTTGYAGDNQYTIMSANPDYQKGSLYFPRQMYRDPEVSFWELGAGMPNQIWNWKTAVSIPYMPLTMNKNGIISRNSPIAGSTGGDIYSFEYKADGEIH